MINTSEPCDFLMLGTSEGLWAGALFGYVPAVLLVGGVCGEGEGPGACRSSLVPSLPACGEGKGLPRGRETEEGLGDPKAMGSHLK